MARAVESEGQAGICCPGAGSVQRPGLACDVNRCKWQMQKRSFGNLSEYIFLFWCKWLKKVIQKFGWITPWPAVASTALIMAK